MIPSGIPPISQLAIPGIASPLGMGVNDQLANWSRAYWTRFDPTGHGLAERVASGAAVARWQPANDRTPSCSGDRYLDPPSVLSPRGRLGQDRRRWYDLPSSPDLSKLFG